MVSGVDFPLNPSNEYSNNIELEYFLIMYRYLY
jgi:hypothetical protein